MTFPLDAHLDAFINGAWVDITADVELQGDERVTIERGRRDESGDFPPSRASWQLNNGVSRVASTLGQTGVYSPLNPMSPYYGLIGRNTPVRWRIGSDQLFIGEVKAWPPRWNRIHTVQWVPVDAYGSTARLGKAAPLQSATRRYIPTTNPVAYWHMEEGKLAENSASAVNVGTYALRPASGLHAPSGLQFGAVQFGAGQLAPWLPAGVARSGTGAPSALWASVGMQGFAGQWTIDQLYAGTTGGTWSNITDVNPSYLYGGGSTWPQMMLRPDDGTIQMSMDGTPTAIPAAILFDGNMHHIRWTAFQSGAQVVWAVYVDGIEVGAQAPTMTLPPITVISLYAGGTSAAAYAQKDVAIWLTPPDLAEAVQAARGWVGETAGWRIDRLCREDSVPLGVVGDLDATTVMGPQYSGMTLLAAVEEAAEADAGLLFEPRQIRRSLGDFEDGGTAGWEPLGTVLPTFTNSTVRAHSGTRSGLVAWPSGAAPVPILQQSAHQSFVPGVTYTVSCWVWVPTGSPAVVWALGGIGFGSASTLFDQWQQITQTFVATAATHQVQIWPMSNPSAGQQVWIDDADVVTDERGLCYRTRESLYNQTATMPLDYAQGHLSPPFEPTPDDRFLVNKCTVTRRDGGSATIEQTTGPLSTARPQDGGVGTYHKPLTLALRSDTQATQRAAWEVHRGTVDAPRYTSVKLDMNLNPALADEVIATDLGDLLTIANVPDELGPSTVGLIVEGEVIELNEQAWEVTYSSSPSGPYEVAVLDDSAQGKLDSNFTTVRTDVTSGATSLVGRVALRKTRWTNAAGQMPIPLEIAGEEVSATAVTDMPITFVGAGTAAHAVNASVTPGMPTFAANDLLLILAACRNSGTGQPVAPAGYSTLIDASNLKLFYRVAVTGDTAPTVTFTGLAANVDTSAQMASFRGVDPRDLVGTVTALNGSAQDIAIPALDFNHIRDGLVLHIGWKQDDWTSVATVANGTEIGEPDTTTGDDQGITWAYRIITTTNPFMTIGARTFTVTGGAAAISRGACAVIAPQLVTFTVTRAVNGIAKSLPAGSPIHIAAHAAARLAP